MQIRFLLLLHTHEKKTLTMTNMAEDETVKAGREEVLERYETFYSCVGSDGSMKVCEDAQLMKQARQVLLTPGVAAHIFTLLPFYPTVLYTINPTSGSSTHRLQSLRKAFEVLELFCVNLFLFPWKKEIKTLKKFTGYFVYYIKEVLPPHTTRSVLHHIGYETETETEFKLSENINPICAKEMGFELFLAQIECEHLIKISSQMSHAEGLEIIQKRGSSAILQEEPKFSNTPNGVLEGGGRCNNNFQFIHEPDLKPLDVEVSKCEKCERGSFLSEDNSILEMQKDYPDLTFRQRPIFKSLSAKVKRSIGRDMTSSCDSSGPQSLAVHTEALEPALDPCSSEDPALRVNAESHPLDVKHGNDTSLTDLAEMMDKLKLKEFPCEESLKRPVEETTQCEKNKTIPILCSPSQDTICNIIGCSSCSDRLQQHHGITQPPQSFYIPNCRSSCAPASPSGHEDNKRLCSRAAEPVLQHSGDPRNTRGEDDSSTPGAALLL